MPTIIRTCLFDMGNVLLFFSHERMCAEMGRLCGRTAGEVRAAVMDSGLQARFECGLPARDYHRLFTEAIGANVEFDALLRAHCDIFRLNEAIVPVVDALQSQGVRLVLLSNTDEAHFEHCCRRFDVLDRFDAFVASCRVGAMKPSDAIYRAALEAIDCAPHECFYTDDIGGYVERGREFGLDAETYTSVERLAADLGRRGLRVTG
ncbi:MAG TPA: HAD family phosphatase [Planctomycetaceae bacterium]|nr:HAD family phosphatase [Planctomycetaceae bacterium]